MYDAIIIMLTIIVYEAILIIIIITIIIIRVQCRLCAMHPCAMHHDPTVRGSHGLSARRA